MKCDGYEPIENMSSFCILTISASLSKYTWKAQSCETRKFAQSVVDAMGQCSCLDGGQGVQNNEKVVWGNHGMRGWQLNSICITTPQRFWWSCCMADAGPCIDWSCNNVQNRYIMETEGMLLLEHINSELDMFKCLIFWIQVLCVTKWQEYKCPWMCA